MKTRNFLKKIAFGIALTGVIAYQAGATLSYDAYTTPAGLQGNQPEPTGSFSLGNLFTVAGQISVTALGAFDPSGNFGSGINVAIYSVTLSGSAITGASLVSGASASFSGVTAPAAGSSTAFSSITPVTLGSGTYLVVANNYGLGGAEVDYNPYYDNVNSANQMTASTGQGVTFSATGYSSTSPSLNPVGWTPDSPGIVGSPRYGAGNFQFTQFAPVPEAATFATASAAVLGLVYIGRLGLRKRKIA